MKNAGVRLPSRREVLAAAAGFPAVARPRRPNILLFLPDQHRFDWTPLNRALPLRMPNYSRLSKQGVEFTRAVVASPLCAPSRASLASGREYHRCGVRNNRFDYPLEQPTYYAALREAGYHVAGCGKFDLHKGSFTWGLDGRHLLQEWGFSDGIDNAGKMDAIASGAVTPKDPYMAMLGRRGLAAAHVADFRARTGARHYANTAPTPLPENAYCDNWIGNNGLKLLRAVPRGRPWHLVVNFTGPHSPMDITKTMERACRGRTFPQPAAGPSEFPPEVHNSIRQNYGAMIENIDRWLGVYLDEIRRRGDVENTVVVWSSDHGEMLGDHGRWAKSVPYQPSIGVPLLIWGPLVQKPGVSRALVSHFDLAATFLDAAGAAALKDSDSRSLAALLAGHASTHRECVRSGLNDWRAVYDGRFKLVRGFDPTRPKPGPAAGAPTLLFDLEEDPNETQNLAAGHPAEVIRLSNLLMA